MESKEGRSLDPTWTAEIDAASLGLGYRPSCPDPPRTYYLDGNVALLQPRGVCGVHGPGGAALPPTGSSPGRAAAGSPGGCDDETPIRDYSVAGSPLLLLRWRSLGSHYYYRCRFLLRSGRNGRSRSGTESVS